MLQRLMIPLIALIFAGATAYIARNWIEEKDTKPAVATAAPVPEVKYKKVLVASSALGIGSFVKPDSLEWQKWPDVDVPDSYFVEGERSKTELDGAVVRLPIVVGEPITEDSMVKPGDRGFLAVVLDPDMRAVSIPVDEASSNAGLISPGDRVDVILTQNVTVKGPKDEDIARRVSETVLQDVKVIAMGRQMDPAGLALPDQQGRNSNGQARTTTLEVTPRGAELVAVATELGKISLSLRSLASRRTPEDRVVSSVPTWDSDVSHALQPTNGKSSELVVIRGSSSSSVDVPAGTGK